MAQENCPICQDTSAGVLFQIALGSEFSEILHCRSCHHRWLATDLHAHKMIEATYDRSYAGFRRDLVFESTILSELRDRIAPLINPAARILDVGCGNGSFLEIAQNMGYSVHGIDVSRESVDICNNRNLSASTENFITGDFPELFDLITMWDVVEHLHDPLSFINRSAKLLTEEGILLLKILHYGKLNFDVLKIYPRLSGLLLGAPGHVQYFSMSSLELALSHSGFKTVKWFPQIKFRSRPPSNSFKQTIGQLIQDVMYQFAGNRNFYLIAAKSDLNRNDQN